MIRKITYRQLYILVATMLAVTSCTGDDTLTDTKVPMTFACNAIAQTRAGGDYVDYDGPAFGVAAMHHQAQSNRPTADITTYIDNAQVSKQGSVWATNPIYYWPHQGDMHFAAYSPYIPDLANSNVSITLPQNGEGYTYSGTIDGQTNLMFADEQYGSYDGFQNGTVPVVFNHALTQVRFCAKMSTASAGTTFNIKSLQLVNVRSRGTVNFTHDGTSWNTENRDSLWTVEKTFPVGSTYDAQHLDDYPVSTTGMTGITDTPKEFPGCLYLMPQQLYADTESQFLQQLQVTYTITSGGVEGAPITKTVPLKNVGTITQWTVNKSVLYTLIVEVGKPLTLTVTAQPWTLEEFTNEFSNTVTVNTETGNDGRIKWTAGTYEKIEADKVVLKDDISIPAELKFTIAGPLGNTWQAILVTKSGDPGAFILSQTEGAIGEECTLTIKAKQQNTSNVSNQAELLFVVRTSSGILPVDILTTLGEGNNYTIIQNINK